MEKTSWRTPSNRCSKSQENEDTCSGRQVSTHGSKVSIPEDSSKKRLESEMKCQHILIKVSTPMDIELPKVKVWTHDIESVDT